MQQIIIKNQLIDVNINKKLRTKRLTLRIDMKTGQLKVSAPRLMPTREILYFLREKSNWIEKHLDKFREVESKKIKRKFENGEELILQGQKYALKIEPSDKKRSKVTLMATEILAEIHKGLSKAEQKRELKKALNKFYKQLTHHIVNARLEHFNKYYRFDYKKVGIKELKSRWGSCSSKKNLNFNWKLVMAPPEILDYVVIHELCHLKEMNHSGKYWQLVEQTDAHYKRHRKWLKENGTFLSL